MRTTAVVLTLLPLLTLAPILASAQRTPRGAVRETGVEVAALMSKPDGREHQFSAPLSVRFGFFSEANPWGTEFRVGWSDVRSVRYGRTVSMPISMNVLRRLGDAAEARSIAGTYATFGIGLNLTAPDNKTTMARAFGWNAGLGRRIALGTEGTLRPEVLVMHDYSSDLSGPHYPAATRVAVRIGASMIDR